MVMVEILRQSLGASEVFSRKLSYMSTLCTYVGCVLLIIGKNKIT